MSISSFFEHAFAPVANVGNALIHGDITGGQYQASLPDYLKVGGTLAAAALPFIAGPALAGLGGEAAAAGALPAVGGGAAGIDAAALDPAVYDAMAADTTGALAPNAVVGGDFAALGGAGAPLSLTPSATALPGVSLDALAAGGPAGATGGTIGTPLITSGAGSAGTMAPTAAAPWYAGIPGATTVANFASANPMTTAALGIGGASLIGGQKLGSLLNPNLPYQQQQENVAGAQQQQFQTLSAEGQQLEQPLLTGQLPPGWQAVIDQQLNQIRAQYARLGLTGSTMEAQDLATAQTTGALSIAQQLANSGQTLISDATSSLGAEAGVYQNLMNQRVAQDTATQQTLGSFAGALALAGGLSARNPATAATSSTSVT
jgi:hypothetical protein